MQVLAPTEELFDGLVAAVGVGLDSDQAHETEGRDAHFLSAHYILHICQDVPQPLLFACADVSKNRAWDVGHQRA